MALTLGSCDSLSNTGLQVSFEAKRGFTKALSTGARGCCCWICCCFLPCATRFFARFALNKTATTTIKTTSPMPAPAPAAAGARLLLELLELELAPLLSLLLLLSVPLVSLLDAVMLLATTAVRQDPPLLMDRHSWPFPVSD